MAGDYGLPFSSVVFMLYVWSDLNTASSSSLCFAVAWERMFFLGKLSGLPPLAVDVLPANLLSIRGCQLVVGSLRFCWGGSLVLRGLKFSVLMILPVVADLLVKQVVVLSLLVDAWIIVLGSLIY
ncbi:unnamed protein product [Brassica rapa]|uniref:Uncharacterized protein n=1 Tax=Brassica campestris TaxID=3711 RepID=A0A8D9MAQ9_BRACM|nr:unnamed protein product [Brassica rapa]